MAKNPGKIRSFEAIMAEGKPKETLSPVTELVAAIKILNPCSMCEWEFDPENESCPCFFKITRDAALEKYGSV